MGAAAEAGHDAPGAWELATLSRGHLASVQPASPWDQPKRGQAGGCEGRTEPVGRWAAVGGGDDAMVGGIEAAGAEEAGAAGRTAARGAAAVKHGEAGAGGDPAPAATAAAAVASADERWHR